MESSDCESTVENSEGEFDLFLPDNKCSKAGLAARVGNVEMLQFLINDNDRLDKPDKRGWLPLHEATFGNHTEVLKLLMKNLDKFDINFQAVDGSTALLIAAAKGFDECCEILLNFGAEPNIGTSVDMFPIIEASRNGNIRCLHLLVQHACNINAKYYTCWTALHEAAFQGRLDVMTYLLEAGADVFAQDYDGMTAAYVACQHNQVDCLEYLLEFCEDPEKLINTCATGNASCVYVVCQEGYDECLKILLRYNADVNVCLEENNTHPIVPAAKNGFTRCMNILLPLINPTTIKGADAVFCAAEEGRFDSLELLIKHNFPVNRTSEYYRDFIVAGYPYLVPIYSKTFATPLCMATSKYHFEIVKMLLDNKATASFAESNKIFSPLLMAIIRRRRPEILKAYLGSNVDLNACCSGSVYQIPEALLASLHPVYHGQLLLMLKCGLLPMLDRWCGCKRKDITPRPNLLAELKSGMMPEELLDIVSLILPFAPALPNCCNAWKNALGEDWLRFSNSATNPPSLSHLCRLSIRRAVPTSRLLAESFGAVLPLPKILADFVTYKEK